MPAAPARTWMRPTAGLLAAAATAWAAAQGASPASADCRRALDALEAQESRLIAARQPGGTAASAAPSLDGLKPLRTAAARACLGGNGEPPPPTARLLAPVEMPRAATTSPWRPPATLPRPAAPAAPMPPPPPTDRPVVVTHCDASGCWANDGIWRPRVGATLGGPRGLCTTQGTLVSCP
jgi:hypothetical protein